MKRISCRNKGEDKCSYNSPRQLVHTSTALPYCILEPLTELELCILNIHTKFLLFSIKVKFLYAFFPMCKLKPMYLILSMAWKGHQMKEVNMYLVAHPLLPQNCPSNYKVKFLKICSIKIIVL